MFCLANQSSPMVSGRYELGQMVREVLVTIDGGSDLRLTNEGVSNS